MENGCDYLCRDWLIVNTISGLSVKELPEEELISADQSKEEK